MAKDNANDHVSNDHGITWQILAHVAGGILLAIGAYFGSGLITKVQALEIEAALVQNRYSYIIDQLNKIDNRLDRIEIRLDSNNAASNKGFPTTTRR